MVRLAGHARAAALAFTLAGTLAGCDGAAEAERPTALRAPSGFTTAFEEDRRSRADFVEWRTRWQLRWRPVTGATSYVVRTATSEGPSGRSKMVAETRYLLEVAAGTSPAARLARDRTTQLALIAAHLRVQVAARGADGRIGPASPWFAVGEGVPPG